MATLARALLTAFMLLLASGESAFAYIGPGAGLAAIGTVVALIGAVGLVILGFVWYPIKRLRAKLQKGTTVDPDPPTEQPEL